MKSLFLTPLFVVSSLFTAAQLRAQDKPASAPHSASSFQAYDLNREQTFVGTVVTYNSSSTTAPAGPRVSLQTPSGLVDVHLGDARLLAVHKFDLQPGDTLRIVGENITYSGGTQFVARIIQKGSQALLLRTFRGFPIISTAPRAAFDPAKQGSAL